MSLLHAPREAVISIVRDEAKRKAVIISLFAFVVTVAAVGLAVTLLAVTTDYLDLGTETLFEAALITSLSFHLFPRIFGLISGLANRAEQHVA